MNIYMYMLCICIYRCMNMYMYMLCICMCVCICYVYVCVYVCVCIYNIRAASMNIWSHLFCALSLRLGMSSLLLERTCKGIAGWIWGGDWGCSVCSHGCSVCLHGCSAAGSGERCSRARGRNRSRHWSRHTTALSELVEAWSRTMEKLRETRAYQRGKKY